MNKVIEKRIKQVEEEVVKYVADDGQIFFSEKECLNYEKTAKCVYGSRIRRFCTDIDCKKLPKLVDCFFSTCGNFGTYIAKLCKPESDSDVVCLLEYMKANCEGVSYLTCYDKIMSSDVKPDDALAVTNIGDIIPGRKYILMIDENEWGQLYDVALLGLKLTFIATDILNLWM